MSQAQDPSVEINRPLVGILAIACFVGAGVVWGFELENEQNLWVAGFIRVGLLMSAFWLALPSKGRAAAWANVSPWTFAGLIAALFAMTRYPKMAMGMIIVLVVLHFFIRPRIRQRRSIK